MQLRDKLLSAAPLSGDIESVVCAGKRGMINNDITDVVIAQFVYIGVDIFHVTTRYKCRFIIIIIIAITFLSSFYFISIRKQIADSLPVATLAILTCFQIPSL